ncbi:transglutaminase-like cysteine peptidase [Neorhizobium alkalisoli]|uniref:Putative transglutaminase-like cysteine proteinase n=1 Tax=Neorhizobium alkalisoli TaxID=528178 RepID=A0A561QX17_9HYPH|nr:transglutaminase-like cysteine peptidase [Neorhizobium alkalisoli]TWF54920.1 putative transglutaminase-like cysteine proteinase [Neorhizobium alkalisoli]
MIRKLIVSVAILAALIISKEAHAAGPSGLAFVLSGSAAIHAPVAEDSASVRHDGAGAADDFAKQQQLSQVNAGVNRTVYDLDTYLGSFDKTASAIPSRESCFDCAALKRDQLLSLGWSADDLQLSYLVTAEGQIDRVLVVKTAAGEVTLGDRSPIIEMVAIADEPRRAIAPVFHPL